MSTTLPVGSPELHARLGAHAVRLKALPPAKLFADGQGRQQRYALEVEGLVVDYSRQLIDEVAWRELLELGAAADVPGAVRAMYAGEPINHTEQRAALATADIALPGVAAPVGLDALAAWAAAAVRGAEAG